MNDEILLHTVKKSPRFLKRKTEVSIKEKIKRRKNEESPDNVVLNDKFYVKKRQSFQTQPTSLIEKVKSCHKKPTKFNRLEKKQEKKVANKHDKDTISLSAKVSEVLDISEIMSEPVDCRVEPVFSNSKFAGCKLLHPHIVATLAERLQITTMTAIQKRALPLLLAGRDALLKAQTGSGKSLAFLLPLVQDLQAIDSPPLTRGSGTRALILLPTRELATQTQDTLATILRPFVRIVSGICTGGTRKKAQKASLRRGLNIIVATPNRLLDHARTTKQLDLSFLRWLVIDEADRLMEMGFEQQVRDIIEYIVKQREANSITHNFQTVLLSATLSAGVERLAGLSLQQPERIEVEDGNLSGKFILPSGLNHYLLVAELKMRLVLLISFILLKGKYSRVGGKIIVFMGTQDSVDFHYRLFCEIICRATDAEAQERRLDEDDVVDEMLCWRLHGNMDHTSRLSVFRQFTSCHSAGVLLTTDVAARGVDIPAVQWVVQYTPPGTVVDYVHRVGRTARAGGRGKALLFLAPHEANYAKLLRREGVNLVVLSATDITGGALAYARHRGRPTNVDRACVSLQRQVEEVIYGDHALRRLAEKAFLSSVRAYASFSAEAKASFSFKLLHQGHFAKSFGLREAPSIIAKKLKETSSSEDKYPAEENSDNCEIESKSKSSRVHQARHRKYHDHAKTNMLSEFASGL